MKYIFTVAVLLAVLAGGCEADQVGYLNPGHMKYVPDTVTFRCVLNAEDPEDARRMEYGIPWQSGGLQGIDAGLPLEYRITGIECAETDREAARQFYMTDINGQIELPADHSVPPGVYVFSVEVSNEGGRNRAVLQNALTVVME